MCNQIKWQQCWLGGYLGRLWVPSQLSVVKRKCNFRSCSVSGEIHQLLLTLLPEADHILGAELGLFYQICVLYACFAPSCTAKHLYFCERKSVVLHLLEGLD